MKLLPKSLGVLLLCLTTAISFAQKAADRKETLFSKLPPQIQINQQVLAASFQHKEAEQVSISFTDQFTIKGKVVSNEMKYNNLQTIIIRSDADVLVSISKQWLPNNEISYSGRIFSQKATDGFLLKVDGQNKFYLEKFAIENIMQDCNF
jgi:hypothetical protein